MVEGRAKVLSYPRVTGQRAPPGRRWVDVDVDRLHYAALLLPPALGLDLPQPSIADAEMVGNFVDVDRLHYAALLLPPALSLDLLQPFIADAEVVGYLMNDSGLHPPH